MALTKTTINGTISLPDDTNLKGRSTVTFRLTGFDTDDAAEVIIANGEKVTKISSTGVMTPVALWSNQIGTRQRLYDVTLNLHTGKDIALGKISVPETGGPYDLSALLPIAPPAGASVEQYLAELQAIAAEIEGVVVDASAAVAAAEAAEFAQVAAEAAEAGAVAAQGLAEDARDAAVIAQGAAETAETGAVAAQGLSEGARDAAVVAQGLSEGARDAAVVAQGLAETAQTAAETAQSGAETAETGAVAAQTAAETAQAGAETAETGAIAAKDAAEAAAASINPATFLQVANDLSDLNDATTARGNLGIAFASQAEAEAGTDDTKYMNPLRTAQAIAAQAGGGGGGETLVALTSAPTVDVDLSLGTIYTLTVDQAVTLTTSSASAADAFRLVLTGGIGGYGLSTASYDSVSFSVSAQDATPQGIAFKADGTKMYMAGNTSNSIYQYTLSTPWVLTGATYDSVSFSVGAQEGTPQDIVFKPDGTKMYVLGTGADTVFQYTLSTAWDLSTASYDSVSFNASAQSTNPYGVTFKPDGTKMYVLGAGGPVYQYTLSTAWDVSTASYDSVSFSVATQESSPFAIEIKPDGTKFYALGSANDTVYQYGMSTAWDLSTASYDSVSFSVTSQATVPTGLAFSSDGAKMYALDYSTDTVYQYTTSTTGGITYPVGFKWPGGTPPATPADGETDVIKAITVDTGSTFLAWHEGDDFS